MTQKKVRNDRTIWRDTRGTNLMYYILLFVGLFFMIGGAASLVMMMEFDRVALAFTAFGFLFALFGMRQIGSTDIVFDDETKKIHIHQKSWFYLRTSSYSYGKYADFKKAVVHSEDMEGTTFYSVQFKFSDGLRVNQRLKAVMANKEARDVTAGQINQWWKEQKSANRSGIP